MQQDMQNVHYNLAAIHFTVTYFLRSSEVVFRCYKWSQAYEKHMYNWQICYLRSILPCI